MDDAQQADGRGGLDVDIAAIYLQHRDAMYRTAASVLRDVGLVGDASDVVQDAVESVLASPPRDVENWEAFLVTVTKRKALDRIGSAAVRHAGPELSEHHDRPDAADMADDIADLIDRQREAARIWDLLAVLDERHRRVAWEYIALERPRAEVAAALGVTPARISQMATTALEALRDAMREEGRD